MKNIKFSIVMLVYNTKEEYLRYAISSVLSQTYDNYEFIIIDDGSNEQTKTILNEYKDKAFIKHQENKGMPASRLEGLKIVKGDYVIFVDSDDYINPNTLSIYNQIINEYDSEIVITNFIKFKNNINSIIENAHYLNEGKVNKDDLLKQLCLLHINGTCGRATKKELFEGMENVIDTRFAIGEDVQQSAYVFSKATNFYYTKEMIYYYRIVDEHRSYNDIRNINDSNFLTPVYNIVFSDNQNDEFKSFFKMSAQNSIVYNGFRVCLWLKGDEKIKYLNLLNQLEIVSIIKSINKKTSFVSNTLFTIFNKKMYFIFNILARIYDLFYGMQRL